MREYSEDLAAAGLIVCKDRCSGGHIRPGSPCGASNWTGPGVRWTKSEVKPIVCLDTHPPCDVLE